MIKKVERADGTRWQVYGRRDGKKVYVGTFDRQRDAEDADEDYRAKRRAIARGELPPETQRRLLVDAAATWLLELDKTGSRSTDNYRWFMKALILPALGGLPIDKLRKVAVNQWRDDCVHHYAATTINSALGCLSSAFGWFVEKEWISVNPCRGVKQLKVDARSYNWIRTVPEIERLLSACDGDQRDIVAVAIGTGMRIDEILHLQWDDVDLDRRLLTVQRGRKGVPKTGIRWVPILDSVLPVLRARSLRRVGARLVFPSRTGRVRGKPHVGVAFKAALGRAGLDPSVRFHDLRHTFASHWVMNGGDIFRLAKALGHKSVIVTERTYAHLAPTAWQQDYQRVSFHVPAEPAKVLRFASGRRAGDVLDPTVQVTVIPGSAPGHTP